MKKLNFKGLPGKPKTSEDKIDNLKPSKEFLDKLREKHAAIQPIKLQEIALPLRGKPNAIKEGKNPKGNK